MLELAGQDSPSSLLGSAEPQKRIDVSADRLFIPISLGNHYYTNIRLRRLFDEFVRPSSFATIFLCDQLRHMSYQIQGKGSDRTISKKVALQLAQMRVTLSHCGLTASSSLNVLSWDDVRSDNRIDEISLAIERLVSNDNEVADKARLNCEYFLRKFCGGGPVQRKTSELQMNYLINETALSIFMNECIGYEYEVYRKGSGFVDYLYAARPDEVVGMSGGSARRKLLSLEVAWKEFLS